MISWGSPEREQRNCSESAYLLDNQFANEIIRRLGLFLLNQVADVVKELPDSCDISSVTVSAINGNVRRRNNDRDEMSNVLICTRRLGRSSTSIASDGVAPSEVLKVLERNSQDTVDDLLG